MTIDLTHWNRYIRHLVSIGRIYPWGGGLRNLIVQRNIIVRKIKLNIFFALCSVLTAVQHISHNSFENSTFSRLILQPHYFHATLDWVKECQSSERGDFSVKKWNAENDDPLNIRGRFTSWWWWEVRLFEKSNLKAKLLMKYCHWIYN